MSSSLKCLVPVLDGMNYHDWAVLMQSFLQMQELWDVVDGAHRMPTALTPGATQSQITAYNATVWNTADNKAIGAITLRVTASLRHYRSANQTAHTFWGNLKTGSRARHGLPMGFLYFQLSRIVATNILNFLSQKPSKSIEN